MSQIELFIKMQWRLRHTRSATWWRTRCRHTKRSNTVIWITYQDGSPVSRQSPIQVVTGPDEEQLNVSTNVLTTTSNYTVNALLRLMVFS